MSLNTPKQTDGPHSCWTTTNNPDPDDDIQHSQFQNVPVYRALQPLYVALSSVGVYYRQHSVRRTRSKPAPLLIYCVIMCILVCSNTTRCWLTLSRKPQFGTSLFEAMTALLWATHCSLCMFSSLLRDSSSLAHFYLQLETLSSQIDAHRSCLCSLRRRALGCILVCISFVLVNTSCTIYVFTHTNALVVWLFPYHDVINDSLATFIIFLTFAVYIIEQCVWVLSASHYVMICYVITGCFSYVTRKLRDLKTAEDGRHFQEQFERFRLLHSNVCKLVGTANRMFTIHNLLTFLFQLVLCCVVLYDIIYLGNIVDTKIYILTCATHISWFLDCAIYLGITITAGASLANAVSFRTCRLSLCDVPMQCHNSKQLK